MDYKEPSIEQMHAYVEALMEHYSKFVAEQTVDKPLDIYEEIRQIAERIENDRSK